MIDRLNDPITNDWTDNFSQNTPDVVAQQIKTRLLLWQGEWFIALEDGTPYLTDILGSNTNYDLEIQSRILGTPEVIEITSYSSSVLNRALSVQASVLTSYGSTDISITLQ